MKKIIDLTEVPGIKKEEDHDGNGSIIFRRLFIQQDFRSQVDFVDFTIIPPGSSIGYHEHCDNEEMYLIVSGSPLMTVDGEQRRLSKGSVAVVRSGQRHGLVNDTKDDIEIFVVQVSFNN